jgi:PEP-CTERM motif
MKFKEESLRMYKLLTALSAVALAAGMATAADAATIAIGLQQAGVNGGAITNEGAGPISISYGTFNLNNVSGITNPSILLPQILNSNAIDANTTGSGSINVFVTALGLGAPLGSIPFQSAFTVNTLTAGWTVLEQTFISTSNALWTGSLLDATSFGAIGTNVLTALGTTGAGPYSITAEYTITAVGAGSSNATINVSAVPEPATWGMMLLGFAGLAFAFRQSRRKVSFA